MIQIQLRDAIFETNRGQVTILRGSQEDVLKFNLFPISGKESAIPQLDQLVIAVKIDPDVPGSASKSNLSLVTSNPVSKQVEDKKSQSKTTETLASVTILKPTLKSLRFYVPGDSVDGIIVENEKDQSGFIKSESLLVNFQSVGSISHPSALVARISRTRTQRLCIPVELPLKEFVAEGQQLIIQIQGIKNQRTTCSQQISIARPFIVGDLQTKQRIRTLNFSRVNRSKVRFTAYVENFPKSERINFTYCIWSDSVRKTRSNSGIAVVDPATRSASVDVVCSEREYVEVFATCQDYAGRVCGQPVRSLILPTFKEIDVSCIILRSQSSDGISAEVLGIPSGVTRIKVIRKNLDTHIENDLGIFSVINSKLVFNDPEIAELNYPSLRSRFSYEIYLEKSGSFIRSNHELQVDFNLINGSYEFSPTFLRQGNTLLVSMSPKISLSSLDDLTKDLNQKSLIDSYSDEIKQIRSQTSENFLYDVYTVSEKDGSSSYVGEFSTPEFGLQIGDQISVFVLPKTTTPRQQISAIKKLVERPSLISRSRVSRVSPKSLASSLDSGVVKNDGVAPKVLNQRSLIDGIISDSSAAQVSNLTGHVYSYSSGATQTLVPRYTSVTARRIENQNNLVSWSCNSSIEFSHFMISVSISNSVFDLLRVPKAKGVTKYQIVDPVYGKIPGKVTYTITPVGFDDLRGTPVDAILDVEEVQIG